MRDGVDPILLPPGIRVEVTSGWHSQYGQRGIVVTQCRIEGSCSFEDCTGHQWLLIRLEKDSSKLFEATSHEVRGVV